MAKAETRVVQKIQKALENKFPNIYLRKVHGSPYQHAGIPDLIGCINGYFIGLEVKTEDGKSSLIQQIEGEIIIKARGIYGVVRSPEEAITLIDKELKIKERESK